MKLKRTLLSITTALTLLWAPVSLGTVLAAPTPAPCGNSASAQQVLSGINQAGNNCGDDHVNNLFQNIVQILSIVAGVVSVIVIIYAGLKYMTSGGDANKVSNAKSTLLYALIGLAIAALTQLLIHFVLFQAGSV